MKANIGWAPSRFCALLMIIFLSLICAPAVSQQPPITVGSKAFTESIILGEIAARSLSEAGLEAQHRQQLGGSRIVFEALRGGEISLYPEYTGTLAQELAPGPMDDLGQRLQSLGLAMTPPLGFNNTYALALRADRASELGIETISDLRQHPTLKLGFSNEFVDREDGWRGLRAHYRLPHTNVRGLDHDLAYRGLDQGALDLIDVYTTDAEIDYYDLHLLEDDREFFPEYQAVYLYRSNLSPAAVAVLDNLAGSLTATQMAGLNAQVKLDGASEAAVAAGFLGLETASAGKGRGARIAQRTVEHLWLVAISLGAAIVIAIPLGIIAARRRRLSQIVLSLTGLLQTIPSLAMFVFMIPLLGIGNGPAMAALFVYSLLPIVRNTHAGLTDIAPELQLSARALGLPSMARLRRIELPLAVPTILAGIKTAAVINVGTATLGALIGAGGYGQPILSGIRLDDIGLIMEGAVPAALLALMVQLMFDLLERQLRKV